MLINAYDNPALPPTSPDHHITIVFPQIKNITLKLVLYKSQGQDRCEQIK